MKVTVLGNNGPYPDAGGACSSYLFETGDTRILADCGSGSMGNLMKLMNPADLDAIFLSHLHWDHMTDIPVLFYYLHVNKLNGRNIKPISLYMPQTPEHMYERILEFDMFRHHVLKDSQTIFIKDMEISTASMTHPVETYALGFTSGGKSMVYSGDTTYNRHLPVFAEGCDLLITDSAFLESQLSERSPHMSAAQSAKVAEEAGVRRLLLSHQVPGVSVKEYENEARTIFSNSEASKLMKTYEV